MDQLFPSLRFLLEIIGSCQLACWNIQYRFARYFRCVHIVAQELELAEHGLLLFLLCKVVQRNEERLVTVPRYIIIVKRIVFVSTAYYFFGQFHCRVALSAVFLLGRLYYYLVNLVCGLLQRYVKWVLGASWQGDLIIIITDWRDNQCLSVRFCVEWEMTVVVGGASCRSVFQSYGSVGEDLTLFILDGTVDSHRLRLGIQIKSSR